MAGEITKTILTYPTAPTGAVASANLYQADAVSQLQGYMPILFAKATMKEFYDNSILPRIVNVQYEAELKKMGDKIYIRRKPDIKIGDYKVGKNVSYQELAAPEPIELVVDKGYDWAFREHDVISEQTDIKQYVSELMTKIAQRIRDYIEPTAFTAIIQGLKESAEANHNTGKAAGAKSASYDLGTETDPVNLSLTTVNEQADGLSVKASNLIADLYGVLHEQNVLEGGKTPFIVAPHRFLNVLAKSAIQNASFAGSEGTFRRGQKAVGMIQGCELYTTNYLNCPEAVITAEGANKGKMGVYKGVFPILCGTTDAVTWVQTITKTEKLRDQNQYADLHRGMGIYGFKVIEPKALAVAWVKFTDAAVELTVKQ